MFNLMIDQAEAQEKAHGYLQLAMDMWRGELSPQPVTSDNKTVSVLNSLGKQVAGVYAEMIAWLVYGEPSTVVVTSDRSKFRPSCPHGKYFAGQTPLFSARGHFRIMTSSAIFNPETHWLNSLCWRLISDSCLLRVRQIPYHCVWFGWDRST